MKISGIYQIVNILNEHSYIGSSININKRFLRHINSLNKDKHHSIYLQRAWHKYGAYNFKFIILEQVHPKNLFKREQYFIDLLKPEYNVGSIGGGDNISNHPNKLAFSKLQRELTLNRYKNMSHIQKQQISEKFKGERNPNWKGGISKPKCIKCNKIISPYAKYCSKCLDRKGVKNSFYGKRHTSYTKNKLRQKMLNCKPSNCKRIQINNIIYSSYADAAKALKVSNGLITYRVKKQYPGYKVVN